MRTINQFINLYSSVLRGVPMELYGHTISSDGVNWLVNDEPIDTLNNKAHALNFVIERCEIAKKLATTVGEDISNMYDEYFIMFDTLDGMILLVRNAEVQLGFIYIYI